jgi:AraC-like DNA-binding protein
MPYVETYWSTNGFVEYEKKSRILPDGCVDILFFLYDTKQGGLKPCCPHIIGTMTTFSEITYLGVVKVVGIRFRPGGITAFTRVPVNEFTDMRIELNSVESVFDNSFCADISGDMSINDLISYVDNYLLERLPRLFVPDERIRYAISLFRHEKGNIPVSVVASKACLSGRQFERRFLSEIGISPKAFNRITKFQSTYNFLKLKPKQSLFETAVDCGYYDHAHLIKEFKRLSGDSPSRF